MAIRRERNSRNSNWKRIQTHIVGDMILYVENPKDAIRELLEFINEFNKVGGYKVNTQKSLAFLCTNNERSEEKLRKKKITFTIASKRPKYLEINLPKEAKDLYSENYKTLMKEIEANTDRMIHHVLGLENLIL